VRADLRKQMLVQAVLDSAIVPTQVADRIDRVLLEQREVRIPAARAEQFLSKVSVTDAQVSAFYDSHKSDFETRRTSSRIPRAQRDSLAGRRSVGATSRLLRAEQGRYGVEEQRRASHILAAEGGDKAAARRRRKAILTALKANPGDFARSQGSSPRTRVRGEGGDLGLLRQGHDVKPFEDAAFKLKVGETRKSLRPTSVSMSSASPRSSRLRPSRSPRCAPRSRRTAHPAGTEALCRGG